MALLFAMLHVASLLAKVGFELKSRSLALLESATELGTAEIPARGFVLLFFDRSSN